MKLEYAFVIVLILVVISFVLAYVSFTFGYDRLAAGFLIAYGLCVALAMKIKVNIK